ncbi:MAG: YajQ family cyclic di-GMP-binding protein [Bryobacterales bacterium]
MAQNSFDVVSEIELPEVKNAVMQANKELSTRFDLKPTNSEIELDESAPKITIRSQDEYSAKQVRSVLEEKLVRRKVPLKGLDYGKIDPAAGGRVVQEVKLQQGIPVEKGREIVKVIKDLKLKKVQASIQGEQVRVTGPDRDDLQRVMAALREKDLGIDMQFTNYRSN